MHAGAHILFRKDVNHMLQHGRIIKASGSIVTITTVSSTTEASADQLAPYLPSGSEVMLKPPGSSPRALQRMQSMGGTLDPSRLVSATVLHDDSETTWPPNYTVRIPDASTVVVTHHDFVAIKLPPGSAGSKHKSSDRGGAASGIGGGAASTGSEGLPSVPTALPGMHLSTVASELYMHLRLSGRKKHTTIFVSKRRQNVLEKLCWGFHGVLIRLEVVKHRLYVC